MLEVRLHDTPAAFCLQLSGELTKEAVNEVLLCWQTGSSTLGARRLVVDLTGVAAVDESGRELLERMSRAGAEVISGPPPERAGRFAWLKRILTHPAQWRSRPESWYFCQLLWSRPGSARFCSTFLKTGRTRSAARR